MDIDIDIDTCRASGRSAQHSTHSFRICASDAPPFCSSVSSTAMMERLRSMAV